MNLEHYTIFPASDIISLINNTSKSDIRIIIRQLGGADMLEDRIQEEMNELDNRINHLEMILEIIKGNRKASQSILEIIKTNK